MAIAHLSHEAGLGRRLAGTLAGVVDLAADVGPQRVADTSRLQRQTAGQ